MSVEPSPRSSGRVAKPFLKLAIRTVVVVAVLSCVAVLFVNSSTPKSDGGILVRWQKSGRPGEVAGTVTDVAGKPMPGAVVVLETMASDESVVTDANGQFHTSLGEPELVTVKIPGKGKVEWSQWFAPDISQGVVLDIRLK